MIPNVHTRFGFDDSFHAESVGSHKYQNVFLVGGFDPPTYADMLMIMTALRIIETQSCYQYATLHIVVLDTPLHDYFFSVGLRQSFVEELYESCNQGKKTSVEFHVCADWFPVYTQIVHDLGGGVLLSPVRNEQERLLVTFWDALTEYIHWNSVVHIVSCRRLRRLIKAGRVRHMMHKGKWDVVRKMIPPVIFDVIKASFVQEQHAQMQALVAFREYDDPFF